MEYTHRTIDLQLDELLNDLPAIAHDGPKGVGKTETARRRAATTIKLDEAAGRELYLATTHLNSLKTPIFIDEWQTIPDSWNKIRHYVDDGASAASFLLAGSATPADPQGTHTGAGRIISLRMRPMGLHERNVHPTTVSLNQLFSSTSPVEGTSSFEMRDYTEEIMRSGLPGIRNFSKRGRTVQLESYLTRIVDRELPDAGYNLRNPQHFHQWLRAYAAATGTTTSYAKLSAAVHQDGTQPAKITTQAYREHLSRIWILDPLPGWLPAFNPLKRIGQSPKHYLADPALSASLLNINPNNIFSSKQEFLGPLFEALSVLTVRVLSAGMWAKCYHLRNNNGTHEIDMIIENEDGRILPVEIKLKSVIDERDVRHIHWLRNNWDGDLAPGLVITTGQHAYRRADGIAVVPLALLGH